MHGWAGTSGRLGGRFLCLAIGTVLAATAVATVTATPARAVDSPQSQVVSAQPASWTPWVVDSSSCAVWALAQAGATMIAGGNCHQVRNATTSAIMTRDYIFGFDATTGLVNSTFVPALNGMVHTLVVSDDGQSVYAGGEFKTVNGVSSPYIAKIRVADGALVAAFKPKIDGYVYSLRIANNRLYAGGTFTHVGGLPIQFLTSLDLTTGAVDPNFSATFTGVNNPSLSGSSPKVKELDVSPDGTRMVVLGNFTQVNGQDRGQVVMFDLTAAGPALANWQTTRFAGKCKPKFESYVTDVDFSPDGSYFVIVTTGGYLGNQNAGCDSTTRWETNATGINLQPTWIDFTGGDTTWSVAVTGTAIYTGGHFRWQNNPLGADSAGPGAVSRLGLAALAPSNGLPLTWNPTRELGVGVRDLLATPTGLWIGHDTRVVANEQHQRLAFFPLQGGSPVPQPSAGTLPGTMVALGRSGTATKTVGACGATATPSPSDDVVAQRSFDGASASPSLTPLGNAGTAWGQARGAFMLSGYLYTAWADGSLCKSTFDGTTFGAPVPIALYNNNFASDLSKLTSMFFSGDRIYYVVSGTTTLRWRAFLPEDDVVGATYTVATGAVTGIDYTKVGDMVLVGNRLYFITRSDGVMRRIDWANGAPVSGTAAPVSGPSVNGDPSWASQAAFLYVAGAALPVNQPPTAQQSSSCAGLTCTFSSAGSTDPDGTITSYAWDFGDGTTSSVASPTHSFASGGTFTVTLTVQDNGGLTGASAATVTVTAPAQAPTASFTYTCSLLDCSVNASASHGNGAALTTYTWDFGDGTAVQSGGSATATHSYTGDGDYTITLSVADTNALTDTATRSVHVTSSVQPISFVGESDRSANASTWSVQIPANVAAGDGLILTANINTANVVSAPSGAGWTLAGQQVAGSLDSRVWQAVADSTSAGSTVTLTASGGPYKGTIVLLAYRGTAGTGPLATLGVAKAAASTTAHTTPTIAGVSDGSWVVSMWADKSSATTSIAAPPSESARFNGCLTGGGRICALLTDSGPYLGGTSVGGLTATADAASSADTMWTLVLAPQS